MALKILPIILYIGPLIGASTFCIRDYTLKFVGGNPENERTTWEKLRLDVDHWEKLKGLPSSHSTIPFATWTSKRNIDGDEEITVAFGFLLRHVEHEMASAEPIYEVLDNLQELLARYQTLLLEHPSSA